MVTAHMDSVVGAPGANDNASGTALALELARVMKKTDQASSSALPFSDRRNGDSWVPGIMSTN